MVFLNSRFFWSLLVAVLFVLPGCRDDDNMFGGEMPDPATEVVACQTNAQEDNFFSFDFSSMNNPDFSGQEENMLTALENNIQLKRTHTKIFEDNCDLRFVVNMSNAVGYPVWNTSIISEDEKHVFVPLARLNEDSVSAYFHYPIGVTDSEVLFVERDKMYEELTGGEVSESRAEQLKQYEGMFHVMDYRVFNHPVPGWEEEDPLDDSETEDRGCTPWVILYCTEYFVGPQVIVGDDETEDRDYDVVCKPYYFEYCDDGPGGTGGGGYGGYNGPGTGPVGGGTGGSGNNGLGGSPNLMDGDGGSFEELYTRISNLQDLLGFGNDQRECSINCVCQKRHTLRHGYQKRQEHRQR